MNTVNKVGTIYPQTEHANWHDAKASAVELSDTHGAAVIVKSCDTYRVLSAEDIAACQDLAGDCEVLDSFVRGL